MEKIKFIISILILISIFLACKDVDKKQENKKVDNETVQKNLEKIDNFKRGNRFFQQENYGGARTQFKKVPKDDSNYTEAKKMIKLCEKEISKEQDRRREKRKQENKKEERKRERIEKKYERMFEGSGWLHEKQNKLARQNFKQYKSGYEDCPDGSSQLAFYYKKYVDGYYVHVKLQYAYSSEHHYPSVWVVGE